MPDFQLTVIDERRTWGGVLVAWVPRIAMAALFLAIGRDKFAPTGLWIRVFEQIGWGQWFRYVTGVIQIGGALLLLVPRTAAFGAGLLACTTAGAVVAQIVVFHSIAAIIPGILTGMLVAVGLAAWSRERKSPTT